MSVMQHSVLLLLIEECAFACYYIDTARETNQNNNSEQGVKKMITAVAVAGLTVAAVSGLSTYAIYLLSKI